MQIGREKPQEYRGKISSTQSQQQKREGIDRTVSTKQHETAVYIDQEITRKTEDMAITKAKARGISHRPCGNLTPGTEEHTQCAQGANIDLDHYLVRVKITLKRKHRNKQIPIQKFSTKEIATWDIEKYGNSKRQKN